MQLLYLIQMHAYIFSLFTSHAENLIYIYICEFVALTEVYFHKIDGMFNQE